jgi:2'-5' RNA ligase
MIRLFVGLELPQPVRQMLSFMQGGIPGARWTEEGNHHLTLAFIGEVEEPVAEDIDAVLADIHAPAFDLIVAGVGQFDRNGQTKVVWAGVRANPALEHLQDKVHAALLQRRLPVETRKFHPHITLARLKAQAGQERVLHYLTDHALFAAPQFRVEHFTLFESLRGNGAPVYMPVATYGLDG